MSQPTVNIVVQTADLGFFLLVGLFLLGLMVGPCSGGSADRHECVPVTSTEAHSEGGR